MSRLEKFLGKPKTFNIGGEDLELHPLTVNNLDLVMKLGDNDVNVRSSAFKDMIRLTLKKSIADATDEEIENFGLKYFNELISAIISVNGLDETVKKQDMKV